MFLKRNKQSAQYNYYQSYYVAPQTFEFKTSAKSDIWSFGVILYILLTGFPPFNGEDDAEIIQQVKKGQFSVVNLAECRVSL